MRVVLNQSCLAAIGVRFLVVLVVLAATGAVRAQQSITPRLTITEETVTVSGLTPGSSAVFFAVSRERLRFGTRIVIHDRIEADRDGDGRVVIPLGPVPLEAVWTVTDLETGAYAIQPFPVHLRPAVTSAVVVKKELDGIEVLRRYGELSWVQPKVGAWALSAGDGGTNDQGPAGDGKILAFLEGMTPVGASPAPPRRVRNGDRIMSIDLDTFETVVIVVGKE